jgi:hypothetical protein
VFLQDRFWGIPCFLLLLLVGEGQGEGVVSVEARVGILRDKEQEPKDGKEMAIASKPAESHCFAVSFLIIMIAMLNRTNELRCNSSKGALLG